MCQGCGEKHQPSEKQPRCHRQRAWLLPKNRDPRPALTRHRKSVPLAAGSSESRHRSPVPPDALCEAWEVPEQACGKRDRTMVESLSHMSWYTVWRKRFNFMQDPKINQNVSWSPCPAFLFDLTSGMRKTKQAIKKMTPPMNVKVS